MEELIHGTAAYKIFSGDAAANRLSHAYMLYFADGDNLRGALKLFALKFFGAAAGSREERLILSESLPDMKIYPAPEKKLTADVAASIIEDAALQPLEYDRKLYLISDFNGASPIFQNKLLKILEEPPRGVYFILGATSLSPVLDTVRSRVKLLEIPAFTPSQIYCALQRSGDNPLNKPAAESCGGVLGVARNMLRGDWYAGVVAAAEQITSANTVGAAAEAALKYGDFKYKKELLSEMQRKYFREIKRYAEEDGYQGKLSFRAVVYASESVNKAFADVNFNANFPSLLYDFLLRVCQKN